MIAHSLASRGILPYNHCHVLLAACAVDAARRNNLTAILAL
jgi:hypothetical protein